jgi:DNA-3-methyladenine glycosylase
MVYGTCFNLNLAAEPAGIGGSVLIRALEPLEGLPLMRRNYPSAKAAALTRGPGRLCAALGIGRELSGVDLCASERLWLERGGAPARIQVSTRIGLSRDQHRRLRFLERGSRFVSVPP